MKHIFEYEIKKIILALEIKHNIRNVCINDSNTANTAIQNIITLLNIDDKLSLETTTYNKNTYSINETVTFTLNQNNDVNIEDFNQAIELFQNYLELNKPESGESSANLIFENVCRDIETFLESIPKYYKVYVGITNISEAEIKEYHGNPEYWLYRNDLKVITTNVFNYFTDRKYKKVNYNIANCKLREGNNEYHLYVYAKERFFCSFLKKLQLTRVLRQAGDRESNL